VPEPAVLNGGSKQASAKSSRKPSVTPVKQPDAEEEENKEEVVEKEPVAKKSQTKAVKAKKAASV
jgi:hypothetical protein